MRKGIRDFLKCNRFIAISIIMIFLFSCIFTFSMMSFAVGETFTISVASVKKADLSTTTFTVQISGGTFSGTVSPYLFDGEQQVAAVFTSTLKTNDTTFTFKIDPNSVTDNKYYGLQLVDDSNTYTKEQVGTIGIGTPVITTNTVLSLANGYNQSVDKDISGNFTNFVHNVTTAKLIAGETEQTVTVAVTNSKTLKVTVPVGLAGDASVGTAYDLEITSGTEVVTANDLVVVRGTPSINVTTELGNDKLNQNYTDNGTITVAGTNTKFVQNETTVRVLSGTTSVGTVSNISVTGNGALTFALAGGLAPGSYTVEVETGIEKSTKSLTVLTASASLVDSNDAAFSSLSQGYTSSQSLVFKGTNVTFSDQTTVKLFNGTSAESTDISATYISNVQKNLAGNMTFTLATGLDANVSSDKTYEVRVTTGTLTLKQQFTVKYPSVQSVSFSAHPLSSSTNIPKGYKVFAATATGANTLFQSATKVYIYNSSNALQQTQSVLAGVTATSLSFNINEGLAEGTYKIRVDMDGNEGTTDDILADKEFTVVNPSIEVKDGTTTPVKLVRTVPGTKNLTVTGTNTHFSRMTPIVKLIDGSGNDVSCTIANINVTSDTSLTFDITPSTIASTGSYGLKVQTTENLIIDEIVTIPASENKIVVSATSAQIAPSVIFGSDLGTTSIVITTQGLSIDENTQVKIDLNKNDSYEDENETLTEVLLSSAASTVTFTAPAALSTGTYNVKIIDISNNEVTTSFTVGSVELSKNKIFAGYEAASITITGTNTSFDSNTTVSILDGAQATVANATGAISNLSTTSLDFVLNSGLVAGSYTVKIGKANGNNDAKIGFTVLAGPTAPTTGTITKTSVVVNWTDVAAAQGFKLYRSTSADSGYELIFTDAAKALTYTDTALTEGTDYYYKISATEAVAGESVKTNHVLATTLASPKFVSAAVNTEGTKILVTFDKDIDDNTFGDAPSGFAVTTGDTNTANVVSAVAINGMDSKIIELTLTDTIYLATTNIKLAYTAGTVADTQALALATFADKTVTNNSNQIEGGPTGDPFTITVGTRAGKIANGIASASLVNMPVIINNSQYTQVITEYSMDIVYNSTKITPTGIVAYTVDNKNGIAVPNALGAINTTDPQNARVSISWSGTLAQVPNSTNKGVLFKIIFEVQAGFVQEDLETAITTSNANFTLASGLSNNVTAVAGRIRYGLSGDVNRDGAINALDAGQIGRKALAKTNVIDGTTGAVLTEAEKETRRILADIDGDGQVTAIDAGQVGKYALGKSNILFK